MNKKPSIFCTKSTLGSKSLDLITTGLSNRLGVKKIWRTLKLKVNGYQFWYGHSTDKLGQYEWFKKSDIPSLEFTTSDIEALNWLIEGNVVFGRKLLRSSCGKGIVVMESPFDMETCKVYTKYKKKKREFRVHICVGEVIAVTEKKRRKEFDGQRDTKIRNLANGYVFCQQNVAEPDGIRELALRAAEISASDFCGVDIGYNEKKNELFVIEVNSAPGIQGSNVDKYLDVMVKHV